VEGPEQVAEVMWPAALLPAKQVAKQLFMTFADTASATARIREATPAVTS